jgi:hypothetical protein
MTCEKGVTLAMAMMLVACERAAPPQASVDASTIASADAAPSSSPFDASADVVADAKAADVPLEIQKLVFTSGVKNKAPIDKLAAAEPGQRVYAHVTLRNRGADARPITLVFRIDDEARSSVDLRVDTSWSYRTWAYVTLRAADHGELAVDVRDDAGGTIGSAHIPIRGRH